jgi:hypothetical protein
VTAGDLRGLLGIICSLGRAPAFLHHDAPRSIRSF